MRLRINSTTIPSPSVALLCTVFILFSVLLINNRALSVEGQETVPAQQEAMDDATVIDEDVGETAADEDVINVKHADRFEQREKDGVTIFTGNVQIERPNGFLNADKVTIYENVETNETVKTVAEGNVELRDGDIFVTCAHAVLDHLTDIITFHEDVIVLQNEDRLEADNFEYNRRTGERSGEGNIKVKIRVKSKEEPESDSSEVEESDSPEEEEVEEEENSGGPSNP